LALLAGGVAHATLGTGRVGDTLRSATRVAIVDAHGHVVEAIRGVAKGELIGDMEWERGARAGADGLVVCDDQRCLATYDRGGYFLIGARGPKGLIELRPGLVERRAVATVATGGAAPELCVRIRVHVLDDAVIEGRFSAVDGEGKLARSKLLDTEVSARFVLRATLDPRLEIDGLSLIGSAIARAKDGCFEFEALPEPLLVTRKQFVRAVHGDVETRPQIATGWITQSEPVGTPPGVPLPFRLSALGDGLFAWGGELRGQSVVVDGSRAAFRRIPTDGVVWLDFGKLVPPMPGASITASIATLLADGKPHTITITEVVKDGTRDLGRATIERLPLD
jgi:hypothetical protein